jgi:nitroimidazol reductase NimA-like FMN-containing flavoprotein (pyridoxamine 5'-phosphate oxidase superfamily)
MTEVTEHIEKTSQLETIARDDCVHLLTAHGLGRLAIVVRDQPLILPVNYAMDGERVVFRTDPGTKLYGAAGQRVAFEIDGFDRMYHEGWSVVVIGTAEVVCDQSEHARLQRLPIGPWGPGPKAHWVRIGAGAITGRRIAHRVG